MEVVPALQLLRYHRFQKLTNRFWWQRLQLAFLRWLKPKFYCFNDDLGEQPDLRVVALVRAYLDETYPRPSRFERGAAPGRSLTGGVAEPQSP